MKVFIIFAFIFIFAAAAISAQNTDRQLAPGNPPLMQSTVNDLIDFFEFGLHARFTPAQRQEFQQQRIAEWRKGDPKDIQTVQTLLDTRAKLMSLDEAKLREAQAAIEKYLVQTFGNQASDPTARLLMEVYRSGRSDATVDEPSTAGTSQDVSALFGTWQAGTVSGVSFVNGATGSSTNGGGTQVMYTFKPGGRYEYAALTQSTLYNCTMKALTYKSGIVQINGNTLIFVPQNASFTSEDTCVARNNYRKPVSMERETFNWSVQQDEYGTKLCLQNSSINGCAYKR